MPYALAAAMLLLAVGLGVKDSQGRKLRSLLADSESRMMALEDTLSVLRSAHQVTQIPISMEGKQGGLLIFQDAESHRWCVIVHGLPPAPSGNVYQFWFITETGMVRSVEVNADTSHPAFMTLHAARARPGDGCCVDGGAGGQPVIRAPGTPTCPRNVLSEPSAGISAFRPCPAGTRVSVHQAGDGGLVAAELRRQSLQSSRQESRRRGLRAR